MIPEFIYDEDIEILEEDETSRTFAIDNKKSRVEEYIDQTDAMKQAIEKILSTERYEYAIYSWDYGVEFADLFGMPQSFVKSEIKRRIEEALLQDDRIDKLEDFIIVFVRNVAKVQFRALTIYGDLLIEKEVGI